MKSCCFTGHRPKFFPWGNNTDNIRAKRLISALEKSDETIIAGDFKSMRMLAIRDRYMIDNSSCIIAVYDERSNIKSGTYRALMYAKEKEIEVRQIKWMDFCTNTAKKV